MEAMKLTAQKREVQGKKVKALRKQGKIPAVLYGHQIEPINLTIDMLPLEKTYAAAGESTLVDLTIGQGEPVKVLIHDVQFDHITNKITHADLYQVRMDEKISTEITLKFVGEAPAVKELSGILVTNIHSLKVECLPQYLVHEIEVDLSSLKTLEDAIHVKDIKIPEGMTTHHDLNDAVILIQAPRSDKEMEDLQTKPEEKLPEAAAEEPVKEGVEEKAE
jgi:large subunit ribosomal protein L25